MILNALEINLSLCPYTGKQSMAQIFTSVVVYFITAASSCPWCPLFLKIRKEEQLRSALCELNIKNCSKTGDMFPASLLEAEQEFQALLAHGNHRLLGLFCVCVCVCETPHKSRGCDQYEMNLGATLRVRIPQPYWQDLLASHLGWWIFWLCKNTKSKAKASAETSLTGDVPTVC